jgi:hypothetical protein
MQEEAARQPKKGFICFLKCVAADVNIPNAIEPTLEQAKKIEAAAKRLSSSLEGSSVLIQNCSTTKSDYDSNVFKFKQFIKPDADYISTRMDADVILERQR